MLHKQVAKVVMDDINNNDESEVKIAAVAIPVADAAEMAMKDQEKQGAKCCFICCDYRRAVVAMSILCIIYDIIVIILLALTSAASFVTVPAVYDNIDDITLTQEDQDNLEEVGYVAIVAIVIYAIFFFFNIWTLCAALRYSTCMLSTNVIVILVQFGFNIYNYWQFYHQQEEQYTSEFQTGSFIGSIVGSVIGYGLYLYPVIGLISEIKSGVMSQETYPREAYSCCCNPKKHFN